MATLPPTSAPFSTHDYNAHLRYSGVSNSDAPSSVISPLALPRGATGYFDHISLTHPPTSAPNERKSRAGHVYSPLSPSLVPQFLSPHLTPVTREVRQQLQQQRSVSMSPSGRTVRMAGLQSVLSPPSFTLDSSVLASGGYKQNIPATAQDPPSHPHSASAEGAGPSQIQIIRRLAQQNGRIREAWEAERKYMEANRERAEEVYKEERALMEEERAEWEDERSLLIQHIERLEQQLTATTMGGNAGIAPGSVSAGLNSTSLRISAIPSSGFAELEHGRAAPDSAARSQANVRATQAGGFFTRTTVSSQLPNSSLRRDHPILSRHVESLGIMPSAIPLPSSSSGSMASPNEEYTGPVPIVDIQEIHPELEGIPIKAPAVKKPTFRDNPSPPGSKPTSSASSSPPIMAAVDIKTNPQGKERTLQLLAADVADRLTMHAGHTPNHSLSLLPTATISQVTTASSSGDSTPTVQQEEIAVLVHNDESALRARASTLVAVAGEFGTEPIDDLGGVLEPMDDIALKGPLMVRNMPVHDEIFFRKLSDKLEEVIKDDEAALPAVLKDSACTIQATKQENAGVDSHTTNGPEGAAIAESRSSKGSGGGSPPQEEMDIPLKIKKSSNFGAPFGEFR